MGILITAALFGVLGLMIGHRVGVELGGRAASSKQFWIYNAGVIVVGVILSMLASLGPIVFLGLVVGLIAGAIAGLKQGYGRSEGPWQVHDKAFLVNEEHRKRTEREREAAVRGEEIVTGPDVELMSVSSDELTDEARKKE